MQRACISLTLLVFQCRPVSRLLRVAKYKGFMQEEKQVRQRDYQKRVTFISNLRGMEPPLEAPHLPRTTRVGCSQGVPHPDTFLQALLECTLLHSMAKTPLRKVHSFRVLASVIEDLKTASRTGSHVMEILPWGRRHTARVISSE